MIMKYENFTETSFDGLELFMQYWAPEGQAKGVICLIHGIGEHSSRYEHVAKKLVANKYIMLTSDLRGCGKSQGKHGYIPSYDALLEDIDLLIKSASRLFPDLPVVLYGHSLGGSLVLHYDMHRKNKLLGLICTSPWLKLVDEMPGLVVGLIRFLYWIIPGFVISSGLDPKKVSRDQSVVEKYKSDPLIHDKTSFRVYIQFTDAARYIMKNSGKLSLPVLLMHGSDDLITDPKASQELYNGNKEKINFKLWNGLHHETHNEPEKNEVIDFLIQWLDNLYSQKEEK